MIKIPKCACGSCNFNITNSNGTVSKESTPLRPSKISTFDRIPSAESIIYFGSLLVCISLGKYYKNIQDVNMKKNYGAGLGLLVTCAIFGHKAFYIILTIVINIFIIKCCNRRYVHQMSLAFTFFLLIYLHGNVLDTIYLKAIYQAIALRMVGVAFSVHRKNTENQVNDRDSILLEPTAADILCFGLSFIGIHKGPFYRYKIFHDYFYRPFGILGDCRVLTSHVLRNGIIFGVAYLAMESKFPSNMYEKDEFYTEYGTDYRFLYNIPQLVMYALYHQMVLLFCTAVFTETGFAVYPSKTQPWPGHGPSTDFDLLVEAGDKPELAMELEYNFHTLQSFDYTKILIGPRMKDTMRGWDMTTRYWFWTNMFKSFINKGNVEVRSAYSFLGWTIWSGANIVQLIEALTFWTYVHLEAEYGDLFPAADGTMKTAWDVGFWIMRFLCLIYLTPCFVYDSSQVVLRYYNSIYWVYHLLLFCMMMTAVAIYKFRSIYIMRRMSEQRQIASVIAQPIPGSSDTQKEPGKTDSSEMII